MCSSLWPNTTVPIVAKSWGYEKHIANSKDYCGKLLHIVAGKAASVHYHKRKDETFYLQSGAVEVFMFMDGIKLEQWYKDKKEPPSLAETHDMMERIILRQGMRLHVPRRAAHQIIALEDSNLFEFSTEDFASDSYRIISSQ